MASFDTPVLFMVFNRPEPTRQVFQAIRAAKPSKLYVAADGPRLDRADEAQLCEQTREIATDVDWPCEVKTLFRSTNLGCREAVSKAITWLFETEESGIILEDDCLPHPSFFPYCANLLDHYRDEPRVMHIAGVNFQETMAGYPDSYYFSKFSHGHGWATWSHAWRHFDDSLEGLSEMLESRALSKMSKCTGFEDHFSRQFIKAQRGRSNAWDYPWNFACWRAGGVSCTPRVNLVSNIGYGHEATHTHDPDSRWANLETYELVQPLSHPKHISIAENFDDYVARHHYGISDGWTGLVKSEFRRLKRRILKP